MQSERARYHITDNHHVYALTHETERTHVDAARLKIRRQYYSTFANAKAITGNMEAMIDCRKKWEERERARKKKGEERETGVMHALGARSYLLIF